MRPRLKMRSGEVELRLRRIQGCADGSSGASSEREWRIYWEEGIGGRGAKRKALEILNIQLGQKNIIY